MAVPSAFVTMTALVPGASAGVRHWMCVASTTSTAVHGIPSNATVAPAVHAVPLPVSSTRVPPLVAPLAGSTAKAS